MPTVDDILTNKKDYPDETTLKLADGTEVSLGHLRSGYMKDADYRRKTADVARQRDEFERYRVEQQSSLADAEAKLQELAQNIVRANPGMTREEVATEMAADPSVKKLSAEVAELKQVIRPMVDSIVHLDRRLQEERSRTIEQQHRRALSVLQQQDPDLKADDLIEYAKTNRIPRLDLAYKLMRYDDHVELAKKTAREEGIKQGHETAKKELTAPMIPLKRAGTLPADAPKTMDEAMNRAAQDPDIVGPLMGIS